MHRPDRHERASGPLPSRPGRLRGRAFARVSLCFVFCLPGVSPAAHAADLGPGDAVTVTLVPQGSETFTIDVPAADAAELVLRQLDGLIDVQVEAAGFTTPVLRTEAGREGALEVVLVGARALHWTVMVRPRKAGATFVATLAPFHPAGPTDSERLDALGRYAQAEQLRRENFRETVTTDRPAAVEAQAREAYDDAQRVYEQAGDACGVLRSRIGLARLEVAVGHYASARTEAELAANGGCPTALAERAQALKTVGMAAAYLGAFDASIRAAREALDLYEATGDRRYQGIVLGNLSAVYAQQGATEHALEAAEGSLNAALDSDDRSGVVFARKTLAAIELARGDVPGALDAYRKTLADLETTPYPMIEGEVWNDLGLVYQRAGDDAASRQAFQTAQRVWGRMGYRTGIVDTTLNQGEAELNAGAPTAALAVFGRALAMAEQDHLLSLQTRAWYLIGRAHWRLSATDRARAAVAKALALAQTTGELPAESRALQLQADIERAAHHDEAARAALERALDCAWRAADREAEAASLRRRAALRADLGHFDEAVTDARDALRLLDELRGQINEPELRRGYSENIRVYFDTYVDVLMRLDAVRPHEGHAAAALVVADSARARGLRDLLRERALGARRSVDQALLARERAAVESLNVAARALERLPDAASRVHRQAAEEAVDTARRELDAVRGEVRRTSPRYAELVDPAPLNLDDILQEPANDRQVILEYWLGESRSYVWRVSHGTLHSASLPARRVLEGWALQWRRELGTAPAQAPTATFSELALTPAASAAAPSTAAGRLGAALFPVLEHHPPPRQVAVVADGALQLVPFSLLRSRPAAPALGATTDVTYLPSISTLRWLRRVTPRTAADVRVAIVADPQLQPPGPERRPPSAGEPRFEPLPFARDEARAIATLLPRGRVARFEGPDASRQALLAANWSATSILHLATHAVVDLQRPELSRVVLAQYDERGAPLDGFLRLDDIYDLNAPVDLVVLSGCETAVGRSLASEGIYSLSRAFFYAGASRVVASLWAVDDRATAAFMTAFYRALLRGGDSPAAALREAQRQIAATPRWASEYYWGGFVLQGDWHQDHVR